MYFAISPKQGPKMEGVILHGVGILGHFLLHTGSGFQTLSGTPIPKHGLGPPLPGMYCHRRDKQGKTIRRVLTL